MTMTTFAFAQAWLAARSRTDGGAALVEYALVVALVAVVSIAAVTVLGQQASTKFSSVAYAVS